MLISETIRIALSSIRSNLFRAALTMLGIIIGVGAVITMVALGTGAQRAIDEQLSALGGDILSIQSDLLTRMKTLREAMVKRPPDAIRKLNKKADADLVEVAESAMAREVRDRYVSMADVLSDLQRIKRGKKN